jgi:prepilin signal peptidase PulO-like enzyme (type II secretory pathway)
MKVFGGGDAKLLIGLGGIWPYQTFGDYLTIGLGFVFLLFISGAIYTIFYSLFLVNRNQEKFIEEFSREFGKNKLWFFLAGLMSIGFEIVIWLIVGVGYFSVLALIFVLLPLLYIYTKAVEGSCMIVLKKPGDLIEGDWLIDEVKIGGKTIRKSVHGLSEKDIMSLKKANRKVWIKNGVPFTPAFVIAFIIMLVVLRYFENLVLF